MKQEFLPINKSDLQECLKRVINHELSEFSRQLKRQQKLLTRIDAARKLKVSPNTISEYIKRGQLINRGIGRKILLFESDLDHISVRHYNHHLKIN
jgi:Fic family protein